VELEPDPVTGKRRQVYDRIPVIEDPRGKRAERRRTELLHRLDAGTLVDDPQRLTLEQYLTDTWLPHQRSRVRARTWSRYAGLVRTHVVPRIGAVRLTKLRPLHVQAVMDEMLNAGLAPATVAQVYRILGAALGQAVRWQLLAINPARAAQPPRAVRAPLRLPDNNEIARLLAKAGDDWFRVAITLAVTTGLRRGEVAGLRWPDVNLEERRLRVTASLQAIDGVCQLVEPKTDRARRTVGIPEATATLLRAHRVEQTERRLLVGAAWQDEGFVLDRGNGAPVHPDVYSRRFARLVHRLELDGIRPHDLRHAYGTALLAAGVHPKVASEALGHASVGFTMDTYQHVLPSLGDQAATAIDEAFGNAVRGQE
jgi:integrase